MNTLNTCLSFTGLQEHPSPFEIDIDTHWKITELGGITVASREQLKIKSDSQSSWLFECPLELHLDKANLEFSTE